MKFDQIKKIAVIGDIILDEFVFGSVIRINPEAPVPVLKIKEKEFRLGGAANVANNIVSLGGDCVLIGKIGKESDILNRLLEKNNIKSSLIIDKNISSIKKTRYIASQQQLLRVDEEEVCSLRRKEVKEIINKVGDIDIIIISDYAKGMINQELMDELRKLNKKILVDPKISNPNLFKGVFLLKPNLEETKNILKIDIRDENELEKSAQQLQEQYNSNVLITRGKAGMSLFELRKKPLHVPTSAKEVYDVTGAGDTVIATIGLALASDKSLEEAVVLANHAAGIVVSKVGTSIITKEELFSNIEREDKKVKPREKIINIVNDLKKKDKKIIFTNGCFDILHIGHTRLLQKAKSFGDVLVLGLNTDKSIKRLKGPTRPIIDEKERAEILSALGCVDYIVFFDEDTPCEIISEIKPDIHVKGGNYNPNDYENMPEAKIVHGYGGKIEIVNLINGKSTTDILERIKNGG